MMSAGTGTVAAVIVKTGSVDGSFRNACSPSHAVASVRCVAPIAMLALCAMLACASPSPAASNKVRVTKLSDVAFGTIANLNADAVLSQSVCMFADTATNGYNISATGSGAGGVFELSSGQTALAFDVAWNSATGQQSGTQLSPNVPLTGQISAATHQTCNTGPATSASLIVRLRSPALASATAGTYNGTLTLVVGPE